MRTLLLLLASAVALGGGLAAGSHAEPGQAQAASGVDPRSGGLEIALGEWAISPEARAIRPGPVTFVVTNRGTVRHGLELELRRVDRHAGDHDGYESIRLEPGRTTRMTLNLAPGVYELECFVSHHDDLGMHGLLEVREDAPLLPRPAAAAPSTVDISGFAFKPATLRTTVGKVVTWQNRDAAPHTATFASFSSPSLARGQTYRRRFTKAGRFTYLCALHPGMKGTVVVAAP